MKFVVALSGTLLVTALAAVERQAPAAPVIPKTWDAAAFEALEVPAPDPAYTPKAVSVDYYYRIPVRPIYRGHPVYAPGREPAGYFDSLTRRDPEVIWDEATGIAPRLETEADWIAAGELVFDAAIFYDGVTTVEHVRNPKWYEAVGAKVTKEGILPYAMYVVREKGKVEVSNNACGFCHTRLLPDGRVVKGAQGNFEFDRANAYGDRERTLEDLRLSFRTLFGAPWLKDRDPAASVDAISREEIIGRVEAIPAGVAARHRSSIVAFLKTL